MNHVLKVNYKTQNQFFHPILGHTLASILSIRFHFFLKLSIFYFCLTFYIFVDFSQFFPNLPCPFFCYNSRDARHYWIYC